ncbi:MAG: LysM peptidoglycan-binding domain-containing protein [Deltaproteobacteria bacterium]|nr:LysM peptidoglycan-binding domain-containing protein [Deltaproteobacteria bacterium]
MADGKFDPVKIDEQPGGAVILHRMAAQGLITIQGAASPAPQTPVTSSSGRTYVVQPGETLSAIAATHGLDWRDLWEANRALIPNPDIVHPGQELFIPGAAPSGAPGESPPKPGAPTTVYTVKAGDTLGRIAQDHGLTLSRLIELNPNLIQAGMQLKVPAPAAATPGSKPDAGEAPAWLVIAREEESRKIHEFPGQWRDNPRIIEYLKSTSYDGTLHDEVPWCSAFVNWCITQAGLKGTGSAAASSWRNWGQKLTQPRLGCIVVLNHHVGFYAGAAGDQIVLLGGNQSNTINTEKKDSGEVLAYRWPSNA